MSKARDEAEKRSENYLLELRSLETSIDSRITEFRNDARTKSMELDRLQVSTEHSSIYAIYHLCRIYLSSTLILTGLRFSKLSQELCIGGHFSKLMLLRPTFSCNWPLL